ncbi:hypothetical protein A674_03404 [Salmonella enterica subsp. enterica serovar Enteritidis str. 2009K1651]|uniref:Uncharacterized protein n=1 Tax=Salmonella enteritidis (strain 2009K0958) TaxID=1192586 RepID=A0A656IJH4_SALE2|nr:hypothetical protein A673_00751 [Salmonella enterica subsp. enterica serovar Enteritidis str. 2009K0958]EPI84856.1 hypothetical protein A674_03404 [Salmonella enterica subsp. enterica serovar Enteritidis str. 2009K1651]EPI85505.1 hypothetical protein A675_02448 [Salmonella enterica subsp. enterica serovar Enteritidis str. 2009K1726]EPJ03048.1 hypothetical protein A679_01771 [Salmonella enterica subsp. enterica serovar Enteritidis str. 2010K-0284]
MTPFPELSELCPFSREETGNPDTESVDIVERSLTIRPNTLLFTPFCPKNSDLPRASIRSEFSGMLIGEDGGFHRERVPP